MSGLPLDWLLSPAALGILGLAVGSFLNVLIHRLPLMLERQWWGDVAHQLGDADSFKRVFGVDVPRHVGEAGDTLRRNAEALPRFNIAVPASRCPSCGHAIRWFENIPVVSWLALRGRCSACRAPIAKRYPLIEILTALLFAGVADKVGSLPTALLWCAVVATLITLSAIDWDTTVLPDALTLPLLWAGLGAAALGWSGITLQTALIGTAVGYLSLWSVYWLFKLTTGKEGMGFGDFKLLAAIGAWLGWQAILPVILMASVIGAVIGIAMKASGALREGRYVPFGPFLAGGGVAVILIGLQPVLAFIGWA